MSPRGTTEAAISTLEQYRYKDTIVQAMMRSKYTVEHSCRSKQTGNDALFFMGLFYVRQGFSRNASNGKI